jgi:hypothetical protein
MAALSVGRQAEGLFIFWLTVWEEGTGVEGLPGTRARAGLTQRAMTALRTIVEVFMVAQ